MRSTFDTVSTNKISNLIKGTHNKNFQHDFQLSALVKIFYSIFQKAEISLKTKFQT